MKQMHSKLNKTPLISKGANIYNIFTSIQGEGIYVGVPQIFIRFSGCNLRCQYCDTVEALKSTPFARIEKRPFSGDFETIPNPLCEEIVLKAIRRLSRLFTSFHSITLTGGEPLIHYEFLKVILPNLKNTGLPIFLETNGTLPRELLQVINLVDIISMDIKVPSSLVQCKLKWETIEEFLRVAERKNCYIKVVIPETGTIKELVLIRDMIRKVNCSLPVVIQPVSTVSQATKEVTDRRYFSFERLIKIYSLFKKYLHDIRVIPQVHKLSGWL